MSTSNDPGTKHAQPEVLSEASAERSCEPSRVPQPMQPAIQHTVPTVLGLAAFSMLGVLIREFLIRLFTYPGQPIYALIWAQLAGCFIMGMCTHTKGVLQSLSPALFTGLTTGLCGSITTFSSWQLGVYEEFFNTRNTSHVRFKNFLGGMSVLASTLGCSLAALRLGQIVGDELRLLCGFYLSRLHAGEMDPLRRISTRPLATCLPARRRDRLLGWKKWRPFDTALVVAGLLSFVAVTLVIGLALSTRGISVALLFGPFGTFVRWRLSQLNSRHAFIDRILPGLLVSEKIPWGTFLANVLGSCILAVVHILQSGVVVRPSPASCYVLVAVADGFCGCLTTISTFAAEINSMPRRPSVLYVVFSVVVAQAPFLFVAGIYFKTARVDYPVC
ncbi:hypothetical protein GGI07_001772 [Coemansia sp. Benny D115]|nr:hypothetical protein GGI07_001772 [Coemansia sp. Benny D115]